MEKKFQQLMPVLPIKSFIEAEFSHGNDAKKTWLACQGYYHEDNLTGIGGANGRAEDVAERKRTVAASSEFRLFQITETNLYVRKMTVTDFVLSSIEKNSVENTRNIQLY